jgi:hypothetical protein
MGEAGIGFTQRRRGERMSNLAIWINSMLGAIAFWYIVIKDFL